MFHYSFLIFLITSNIESLVGKFGSWVGRLSCKNTGQFLKAAQFKSEKWHRNADDTAGNNLNMKCTDGEVLKGDGERFGEWSDFVACPSDTIICGIRTKLEKSEGVDVDDTMLNAVSFYCCTMDSGNPDIGEELCVLAQYAIVGKISALFGFI